MKPVWTIFRKELTDTLRDRRTLVVMLVVPMLLFPVLISLMAKVTSSQMKKAETKNLRVGLHLAGNLSPLRDSLLQRTDLTVFEDIAPDRAVEMIRADSLDAAVVLAEDFSRLLAENRAGVVQLYYKTSSDLSLATRRIRDLLRHYEDQVVAERFRTLNLDQNMVHALRIEEKDIATSQERFGKTVGGFLPYIFVLFCFMGCMYPAIDMGAGEKERGTLETLLASPVSRMQILLGKFGVIVLVGVLSAGVSMAGLYFGVRQAGQLPPAIDTLIAGLLKPSTVFLILSLLVPLTIFFAAFLLSLSIFARSFKEAQSIISPLTIVIIIPVFLGMLPGIKLTTTTALIPVLNVSLTSKEIIAGTISTGLLLEVYASLMVLAAIAIFACTKWFEREETLFRNA